MKKFLLIAAFAFLTATGFAQTCQYLTADAEGSPRTPAGWSFINFSEVTTGTIAGTGSWKTSGFKQGTSYTVQTAQVNKEQLASTFRIADATFKYAVSLPSTSKLDARITIVSRTIVPVEQEIYNGTLRTGSGSATVRIGDLIPTTKFFTPSNSPAADWSIKIYFSTNNTATSTTLYSLRLDDFSFGSYCSVLSLNAPPVANAGADQTVSGTSVSLSGSASYDPNGTISSYKWYSDNGDVILSSPNSASTTASNLAPGTYVFTLEVTDNNYATTSDQVVVTVTAPSFDVNRYIVNNSGYSLLIAGSDVTFSLDNGANNQLIVEPGGASSSITIESNDGITHFTLIARDVSTGAMVWNATIAANTPTSISTVNGSNELKYEILAAY